MQTKHTQSAVFVREQSDSTPTLASHFAALLARINWFATASGVEVLVLASHFADELQSGLFRAGMSGAALLGTAGCFFMVLATRRSLPLRLFYLAAPVAWFLLGGV
ncbi:hypothetical protein [uncultured Thiothrix sp.]|jgi:hypothetical protein|uniref:hypothetical protein n=1 Tax=uncultured Thiothrix sp. TaxID=223185 RepID=UPI002635B46F|nr:hypothetical protein [uncultured Thiothrix sp.]HRJ94984.1 hypothetical protein [Candidatus Thiothrix moscowensis]